MEPLAPDESPVVEPAGAVRDPTIDGLPDGYCYGVTRYADIILQEALPEQFEHLVNALKDFDAVLGELQAGGGNRAPFVVRFDESLERQGWGKRTIEIAKTIDGDPVSKARGHEIDMFSAGRGGEYPGAAVEMEWSNKDPFFDRDLLNFQALHREGVLAVGVIVTRGPSLQRLIKKIILNPQGEEKYGESTTHWNKLVSRVNLGGGGECPLLLVGIEPERILHFGVVHEVAAEIAEAETRFRNWREDWASYREAQAALRAAREAALARLPPIPRTE